MAAESLKRTECVKVCFSEQMFLDLNRRAIREDRTLSELVYLIVRDDEYGKGKGPGAGSEVSPRGTAMHRESCVVAAAHAKPLQIVENVA